MLRCLRFLNAARRGGVCVFRMLQHVLDVEVFAFLNAARRGGVCGFFLVLQGVLDVEVFAFFECFNM